MHCTCTAAAEKRKNEFGRVIVTRSVAKLAKCLQKCKKGNLLKSLAKFPI